MPAHKRFPLKLFLFSLPSKQSSVWLYCRNLHTQCLPLQGGNTDRERWRAGDYGLDKPERFKISDLTRECTRLCFFAAAGKQDSHSQSSWAQGYKSSNNAARGKACSSEWSALLSHWWPGKFLCVPPFSTLQLVQTWFQVFKDKRTDYFVVKLWDGFVCAVRFVLFMFGKDF